MRAHLIAIVLAVLASPAVSADMKQTVMEKLGPYKLGTSYEEMKDLSGFKLDEKRSEPEKNLVSAKIIDKRILDTPTIQRFTFKTGRLIRVSIIFHPPERYPEEAVKQWLIAQWGDPGDREKIDNELHYVWHFQHSLGVILPSDGNRWMVSLMESQD